MEVLISLMVAVSIYLILYILLSTHGPVKVRDRISKYFKENNVNDVQEQFIREKNEEENKSRNIPNKCFEHVFHLYNIFILNKI